MLHHDIYNELSSICECKKDANIGVNSWIGTGGNAEILAIPKSINEIVNIVKLRNKFHKNIQIVVIGARSNSIIKMSGVKGITIWLKNMHKIEKISENQIAVECGCLDRTIAHFCAENCISDMEFLIGVPGTMGGNIHTNAGCYGSEIKDVLISCEAVNQEGEIVKFSNKDMLFGYRSTGIKNHIFASVVLQGSIAESITIFAKIDEITKKRELTQPIGKKTAGSTFKNPKIFNIESWNKIAKYFQKDFEHEVKNEMIYSNKIHSWMLIEAAGMKGFMIGGAQVSEKHCNFLINVDNATSDDFIELGECVISKVFDAFGVKLEWEIEII